MLIDARFFGKYLEANKLMARAPFKDVPFNKDGTVALRLMSAKQFSGIARLQLDGQDNPMILPGSLSKVGPSDPLRFREGEAFRVQTHVTIKKPLPKDIVITAVPCVDLLSLGIFVSGVFDSCFLGDVEVTLFSFRRIEISYGSIIANLQFREVESLGGKEHVRKSKKSNSAASAARNKK